jgi:UDP-N-acetylmuramate--alanine ligase
LRRECGVVAVMGHDAAHVVGAELVVVSAAVRGGNPEVAAARAAGIPIVSRAEMLGRLMDRYGRSIAVSGTHGKTTTTGMVACVLEDSGLDPTVLIGGDLPRYSGNARVGASDVFVAEACEAYDSFLDLNPQIAVITNIEADHLDYYGDLENVLRSFRRFLSQVSSLAIVCGDDANIVRLLSGMKEGPEVLTYGFSEGVTLRADDLSLDGPCPSYAVIWRGELLGRITLSVPGSHNVLNSLAAIAVGLRFGASFAQIASGLESFTGTGRRFERLGETHEGVLVVDDYAHHPTEIRATLAAARHAYPHRRIVAVFQPHLPSRTEDFKMQFAESFGDAEFVVLTDIYLAREQSREGVTGAGLAALTADQRGAGHVAYVGDKTQLPARLSEMLRPGDLLLTLGAGDIRAAADGYLALSSKTHLEGVA